MAFPVTIDLTTQSSEQPGRYGPFLDSGNRYEVLVTTQSGNFILTIKKSTDGGLTWSFVDETGGPNVINDGINPALYTCVQYSDKIIVFSLTFDTTDLVATAFSFTDQTWGTNGTAAPFPPIGTQYSSNQRFAAALRSDNTIVFASVAYNVFINTINHNYPGIQIYDPSTDSWLESWIETSYEDYDPGDLGSLTEWDIVPCGITENRLYTQQISRRGAGQLIESDITSTEEWEVPVDCVLISKAVIIGDGGGAGIGFPTFTGSENGGGGGGVSLATNIVTTPGDTISAVIGPGGGLGEDGSGSSFNGTSAGGGLTNGTGGSGDFTGGNGGAANPGGGGGGGGSPANSISNGVDGSQGTTGLDFTGGAGGSNLLGQGGSGGDNPLGSSAGYTGFGFGGGGGGQGEGNTNTPEGVGLPGLIQIFYIPVRYENPCRLFQQKINSDNTLGTLTEIETGQFPTLGFPESLTEMAFDCINDPSTGDAAITFTGISSGRDLIYVGRGTDADPVDFTFQNFSASNGTDQVLASPQLAFNVGGTLYCLYHSCVNRFSGSTKFNYRVDSGTGFGSEQFIGSLFNTLQKFNRAQCKFFSALEFTWGTPKIAFTEFTTPD